MLHTQVELTHQEVTEVWWLPVPAGKAKVGERITRLGAAKDGLEDKDWYITQVCLTIDESDIPLPARIASEFHRESQTITYMKI